MIENSKTRIIKKIITLIVVICILSVSLCSCGGLKKCIKEADNAIRDLNTEAPYNCSFESKYEANENAYFVFCNMPDTSEIVAWMIIKEVNNQIEPIFQDIFDDYKDEIDIVIGYSDNDTVYCYYVNGERKYLN